MKYPYIFFTLLLLSAGYADSHPVQSPVNPDALVKTLAWDGSTEWSFPENIRGTDLRKQTRTGRDGNIFMIAWEVIGEKEALAAGRNPALAQSGELRSDVILEVEPDSGKVVWEWRAWDHRIQEHDADGERYGSVAAHPEKIDLNRAGADWARISAVDYNEELDLLLVSAPAFGEGWIIDHAASSREAAGPRGDLLFRVGAPERRSGAGRL